MRKNNASLTIPEGEVFDIVVTDPLGKISSTTRIKANSYGSLATSIVIPAGSTLGSWSVNIVSLSEPNIWVSGGYTNFQLEIFQNPTFTATVKLSSPEVVNNRVTNTKELANTDINTYWYDKRYSSVFSLEGIVTAKYYNGTTMKNIPFTYRIYKSPHYDDNYWGDCFWGCYYEPTPEFYSE
jgi:hypothetical protein